ncbi:outer membrane protein assembly factor BamA [Rhodobacteraceae bacterium WD3A24]|nr:outer membrane protein assembly factor BamA [Rhodobacteraceae bacterium WD3A24]
MRESLSESSARGRGWRQSIKSLVAAIFVVAAVACIPFSGPAEAQDFRFSTLEIVGNDRIDDQTIAGLLGIAPGAAVSAAALNEGYQSLMASGLFESAEIDPRGATLFVRVTEYPIIGEINFEGNDRLDDEQLAGIVESQERRVYSPTTAEADAAEITAAYREGGRFAVEVTPRIIPREGNVVDLAFEIREGDVVEVERISFVGNRTYSDRRLRRALETTQAGLLRRFIQRDTYIEQRVQMDRRMLTDFYLARGYVDFEILSVTPELARDRDAFFLTFTLREGQSYDVGEISVVSEIDGIGTAPYEDALDIRSGATFTPTLIDNNIRRLERVATNQGRRFVRVEPRTTRDNRTQTIDVEFAIVEGERIFVERIDISGNTTTLDRVVRRQFRTVEGDPLNPREIRRAAERIRALGYFSNVDVNTREGSAPDQRIVDVSVEEQPTGSLSFGASYGVSAGLGGTVSFSERNFLGRGQRLNFSFNTVEGSQQARFNFTEPALLGRDLSFGLGANYQITSQNFSKFDTESFGVSTSLSFPVSEFGRLEGRYSLQGERLFNLDTGSSAILADDEDMGEVFASSLGATYTYDTRRGGLDPDAGVILRFGADVAGLGGDREYVRATALAGYQRRVLNEEVTLRAELEGGALEMFSGDSRASERFTLGGRMRGFEPRGIGPRDFGADNDDALGGEYFAVARFEAEFPLGLPDEYGIDGGLFWDVGSVWGLDDRGLASVDFEGSNDLHWRSAAGFSIFWDTPIGPLRFNFSRPVRQMSYDEEQNFDLTLSTRF